MRIKILDEQQEDEPKQVALLGATEEQQLSIYSLVYVSTSVRLLSKDELSDIVEKAIIKNSRLHITGLLLYSDGNFMQCLEGPRNLLKDLMKSISLDARHFSVLVLWEGVCTRREFATWSMGLLSPDVAFKSLMPDRQTYLWVKTSKSAKLSPPLVLIDCFWRLVERSINTYWLNAPIIPEM